VERDEKNKATLELLAEFTKEATELKIETEDGSPPWIVSKGEVYREYIAYARRKHPDYSIDPHEFNRAFRFCLQKVCGRRPGNTTAWSCALQAIVSAWNGLRFREGYELLACDVLPDGRKLPGDGAVRQFLEARCSLGGHVEPRELWAAWCEWCVQPEQGYAPMSKRQLLVHVEKLHPALKRTKRKVGGRLDTRIIEGLTLKSEAKNEG